MSGSIKKFCFIVAGIVLLSACSSPKQSITADQATIEYDLLYNLPTKKISYDKKVRPILEKRCVVCHGCYDAPCQLKMSSPEGIYRGANPKKVYDGSRILAAQPTRLFIDAQTTQQWRQKGFHTVLNEGFNNPRQNLENSVMYKMLRLKQLHPQARVGMLPDTFDVSLDRKQSCPVIDKMADYASKHPEGGMPYGLPNLDQQSYTTLVHWLAQGAPVPADKKPSKIVLPQIKKWEQFLNGKSKKNKLVDRYIYEHLFQAHLHFVGSDPREFYRLIRSSTPPGQSARIIPTHRPYGSPDGPVYYRLLRFQGSVVAKTHLVYELSDKRMQRYRELFYKPDYQVKTLPGYAPAIASNPIKTFAQLPLKSRYKFLLDDARFFIEGFIKGPICRGQVALNVIEDQFWVVFFSPDAPIPSLNEKFLEKTKNYLASPAELEDNFDLLASRGQYKELFQKYVQGKQRVMKHFKTVPLQQAMKYIWNGNGTNPNAALTIFRHLDSASVDYGFVGNYPKTAWILDYSVLERIHYLLVAGYDVYGNIGHQLNARLYMDFLRTEGEDYFLGYLPGDKRLQIRNSWDQGIRKSELDDIGRDEWLSQNYVSGYKTNDPKLELFQHLEKRLGKLAGPDLINRCTGNACFVKESKAKQRVDRAMQNAAKMKGKLLNVLPDLAFVRVKMGGKADDDLAYTFIINKDYKNVSSMFYSESLAQRRNETLDTQTVVPWLEGAYPNFFYVVKLNDVEKFVASYAAIKNRQQYEIFISHYGIRRTDERFWKMSDWFNAKYRREQPEQAGLFDLNRYQNR